MSDDLELELGLSRRDRYSYTVELRVDDPGSSHEPARGAANFDEIGRRDPRLDPTALGGRLFADLFASADVRGLYDEARAIAQRQDRPLRLRLRIHSDAVELHDLPWETLRDERPGGGWLLTNERVLFSRFLASAGWEPVAPRAAGRPRALVVIANPADLATGDLLPAGGGQPLAPVEVAGETERARASLGDLFREADVLASDPLRPGQVTLDRLCRRLREGFDLVYLACHGALITRGDRPGPRLLLEEPDGAGVFVPGDDLVEQIQNLAPDRRPGLVALASCQSGGRGVTADAGGALAALGPQLAQAGVPAVLAMQGSVSQATLADFMPDFFRELRADGRVDRAMAVARGAVVRRPDAWMPALYLRLPDGRLWLAPAAAGTGAGAAPGTPFQAPMLRANFVPRPEAAGALVSLLTRPPADGREGLRMVAIHGLAGGGKSTLAVAVARDPAVMARYPDGVLWATLGQGPEVGGLLGGWVQALGDYDFRVPLPEAAQRHLASLLRDRAVLLVIDDAWSPEHVVAMLAGGPRCAVLITTREALVATAAGAAADDVYELGVMRPAESLALLAGGAGRAPAAADRALAGRVAEAVGHLPLALELAAAQVADGVPWAELDADLRREIARLESLEDPSAREVADPETRKRLSLVGSLTLSLRRLPATRRRQFAWFGALPDDAPITPAMAATLWAVEERDARDALRYFRAKALLGGGAPPPDGPAGLRLHDLVHDMARRLLTGDPQPDDDASELPGLGLPLAEAQRQLLERYRRRTGAGGWRTLPDDGYIHAHLIWHLERAGRPDEVHAMLREETERGANGWFDAREALADSAGYAADVRGAWLATRPDPDADPPGGSAPLHLRYTLVLASLNALARNVPPALMDALVEAGIWTPPQAFSYAERTPDPGQRARALALLAPRFVETTRGEIFRQALAAVEEIGREAGSEADDLAAWLAPRLAEHGLVDEALRLATERGRGDNSVAAALAGVAPYLDPPRRAKAVQRAARAAMRVREVFRAGELAPVVPLLSYAQVGRTLAAARTMESRIFAGQVEAALAPRLAELGRLDEAVALAESVADPFNRAEALAALLPRLPEPRRAAALDEILALLRAAAAGAWPAALAAALAGEPEIFRSMIELIVSRESWQAGVLAEVAPFLTEPSFDEIFRRVLADPDEGARAHGIAALLPHLPDSLKAEDVPAALEAARWIDEVAWRARALAAVTPALPAAQREPVGLEIVETIPAINLYDRIDTLVEVFPRLPETAKRAALELVGDLDDQDERDAALDRLAPDVPATDLRRARQLAQAIRDGDDQALALAALAPGLTEPMLAEALASAGRIGNVYLRAKALVALAPSLPGPLLDRALAMAREIDDASSLAEVALPGLAPCFPEPARTDLLREALGVVATMDDGERAAWAMESLRDLLPDSLVDEALRVARDAPRRVDAEFASLALALNLAALAPRLPEPLRSTALREALDAVRDLDGDSLSQALAAVASQLLDEPLWLETLAIADQMGDLYLRSLTDGRLIATAPADRREEIVDAVLSAAKDFQGNEYVTIGEQQERALARIAPYVNDLATSLEFVATRFEDQGSIREALIAFAPQLPDHLLPQALEVARSLADRAARAEALLALGRHAPAPLKLTMLGEALAAAVRVGADAFDTGTLDGIVAELAAIPLDDVRPLWLDAVARLATLPRRDALRHVRALAPLLLQIDGAEAAQETYRAIRDAARWWP